MLFYAGLLGDCLEDRFQHGLSAGISLGTLLGSSHGSPREANDNNIIVAFWRIFNTTVVSTALICPELLIQL
jgi:hypothetical protein